MPWGRAKTLAVGLLACLCLAGGWGCTPCRMGVCGSPCGPMPLARHGSAGTRVQAFQAVPHCRACIGGATCPSDQAIAEAEPPDAAVAAGDCGQPVAGRRPCLVCGRWRPGFAGFMAAWQRAREPIVEYHHPRFHPVPTQPAFTARADLIPTEFPLSPEGLPPNLRVPEVIPAPLPIEESDRRTREYGMPKELAQGESGRATQPWVFSGPPEEPLAQVLQAQRDTEKRRRRFD